jgi:hypothetical protein
MYLGSVLFDRLSRATLNYSPTVRGLTDPHVLEEEFGCKYRYDTPMTFFLSIYTSLVVRVPRSYFSP